MKQLVQLYTQFYGQEPAKCELLGGAASNRRYYRMYHNQQLGTDTVIGVIGENQKENHAFLALARHMAKCDLPVPAIYASTTDEMRYIQQDLGKTSLYDLLKVDAEGENTRQLLHHVMQTLPRIQFLTDEGFSYARDAFREPSFCRTTISWDLNYFKYCFLKLTGYPMDEWKLEPEFEKLTAALLDCTSRDERTAFLYRDFQSRNVMINQGKPWFIDFQGGYQGPVYYDVASFLWQTRANYSPSLREELIDTYIQALQEFDNINPDVFRHRLRVFVFFRLLQTLGTYGYRGLFEHKAMFQTPISQALQAIVALTENATPPLYSQPSEDIPAIDTFNIEQSCPYLCQMIAEIAQFERFKPQPQQGQLIVRITSFSYKRGIPEDLSGNGGGFVFDCRAPLNPGRFVYYKKLTGLDQDVIDFLEGRRDETGQLLSSSDQSHEQTSMQTFVKNVYSLVDPAVQTYLDRGFTSLVVNCGCTGGQHRSVYCAQHLAEHLSSKFPAAHIELVHREQQIKTSFN